MADLRESIDNEKQSLINEHPQSKQVQQSGYFIYVITFFAAVGGFLFGYDTGVVSGAMLFVKKEFELEQWEQELFISIALAGAVVGSFMGGPASDKWGRRPIIAAASALFIAGSVVLAAGPTFWVLIVGRFIVGLGIGIAANIVPVYVAEVAPSQHRGALVTVNNLCITTGQLISYLVDSAFAHVDAKIGWRFMLGLAAIPAAIQLLGMLFVVPESPRWHVNKGDVETARKILCRIRGGHSVDEEIKEIEDAVAAEGAQAEGCASFLSLFSAAHRPALILGMLLQASQQFCGINTAMYYSATILQMAGYTKESTAIWFSDLVALTNAAFTIVALYFIDRVGRRKLLLISLAGLTLGLVLLGLSFYLTPYVGIKYTGIMAIASLVFYVAFFAIGMGPIPWAVNSEIYVLSLRGQANGLATTVNWTTNLIVSMTFLSYIDLVHKYGAFWSYAGIGVISFVYFYFKLPETKGKTIEEIQEVFHK